MISLTCTSCRTKLTIDDAFAGGVCRCQHCGTIQTVPSRLKGSAATTSGPAKPKPQKTLHPGRGSNSDSGIRVGTGLDELAEVVASSGLTGSGLQNPRLRSSANPQQPPAPPPRSLTPWLAAAGIVIVVLLALVLYMSFGRPKDAATAPGSPIAPSAAVARAPVEPNFCGLKLDGQVVIYVLDRGNGTRDVFDALKEATYRSIESLGADRRYQVIFWNNGTDDAYPGGTPSYATKESLTSCRRAMEDITAFGQSDPGSALKKAVANHADVIVLATAKALEPTFVEQVLDIRKSSPLRVVSVAIDSDNSPLKEVATRTGGEYRVVSASRLQGD